jgi:hypothetical protein
MEAFPKHLIALKALLNTFADSIGLRVNYQKSNIYPINVDEDRMKALAKTFWCQMGTFPFTYLGFPLGTTKPRVEDFIPLNSDNREKAHINFKFSHSSRKAWDGWFSPNSSANLLHGYNQTPSISCEANWQI